MESPTSTYLEAFNLLCDELIGAGISRKVFNSELLPDCVIKVEERIGFFQNIIEWETWQRVKHTKASRWFAACRWISPNGKILVMEKTSAPINNEFPEKMPIFLTDFKRKNYGIVDGRNEQGEAVNRWLVCHDYGTNLLFENGMANRLKKVEWWDE